MAKPEPTKTRTYRCHACGNIKPVLVTASNYETVDRQYDWCKRCNKPTRWSRRS